LTGASFIDMLRAMTQMTVITTYAFTRTQVMASIVALFDAVRFIIPSFREYTHRPNRLRGRRVG
jgi:hypothetical protein